MFTEFHYRSIYSAAAQNALQASIDALARGGVPEVFLWP